MTWRGEAGTPQYTLSRSVRPDGDRKEEIKREQLASHWVSIGYQLNEGPSGVKCHHHHHMRTRGQIENSSQHCPKYILLRWLYTDCWFTILRRNKYMSLITFTITWHRTVLRKLQNIIVLCFAIFQFMSFVTSFTVVKQNNFSVRDSCWKEIDNYCYEMGKLGEEIRVWSTVSGLFLVFMFSNLSLNFVYR